MLYNVKEQGYTKSINMYTFTI